MRDTYSCAGTCAGIVKRLARLRDELPFVRAGMEGYLQNTEGVGIPNLGRRKRRGERAMIPSAGPSDEFPDASRVRLAIRILRREPLVVVVVSVDHDRRPSLIQVHPERFHLGVIPMLCPRAEKRFVPIG